MLNGSGYINICDVAKDSGWKEPNVLVWRTCADKLRPLFKKKLYEGSHVIYNIDFSNVDTMDGSFIDGLLVTELQQMNSGKAEKKYIYYSNLSESPFFDFELVFSKHRERKKKVVGIIKENNTHKVVTDNLERSLIDTFEEIMKRKEVSSNVIAKIFDISVAAASVRLKNLFDVRMIYRQEELTSTGKEFIYHSLF